MVRVRKQPIEHLPYFAGTVQRGRGLGGILSGLARTFIPIAKRTLGPLAKKTGKYLAGEAIKFGSDLVKDIVTKKKPVKRKRQRPASVHRKRKRARKLDSKPYF